MKLRFGIREKTVAMVMVLSTLPVIGVGLYLFKENKKIVVDHELVDLGDEAQLRAWEFYSSIEALRSDLRVLAASPELKESLVAGFEDNEEIENILEELCKKWDGYCSVSLNEVGIDDETRFKP